MSGWIMRASGLLVALLVTVVADANEYLTRSDALTVDVAPTGGRVAMD